MKNPIKAFGAHEKDFSALLINRNSSGKNENKSQKNTENSRES
jgi:hypothetical protein